MPSLHGKLHDFLGAGAGYVLTPQTTPRPRRGREPIAAADAPRRATPDRQARRATRVRVAAPPPPGAPLAKSGALASGERRVGLFPSPTSMGVFWRGVGDLPWVAVTLQGLGAPELFAAFDEGLQLRGGVAATVSVTPSRARQTAEYLMPALRQTGTADEPGRTDGTKVHPFDASRIVDAPLHGSCAMKKRAVQLATCRGGFQRSDEVLDFVEFTLGG